MHDPDFHPTVGKTAATPEGEALAAAPNCKLAVMSLVFGILGWVVLPLVGALVAVVTGHLALGEIRESGGRLGGRSAAKAGLVLGYIWFVLAILAGLLIGLFVALPYSTPVAVMSTPASVATKEAREPGVKMANQMSSRDVERLKTLNLGDGAEDEDVIAYYNQGRPSDGEAEMAVLTNKRIAYLKGDRLTSFDLKDIETILQGSEYQQKYTPQYYDTTRYMIEIKRRTGGRMRIAIEPSRDGPSFGEALQDAWKSAGGVPEPAAKK